MKTLTLDYISSLDEAIRQDSKNLPLQRALRNQALTEFVKNPDRLSTLKQRFSLDLKTLPVTHQKQSGRCWIFAGLNVIREIAVKHLHLANIEFSQNYIAFYDKVEKIHFFLQTMDQFLTVEADDRAFQFFLKTGIQDGGQWDMFVSLVEKYGLVPKDAMDETMSSSTTRPMNQIINTALRKYAARARELYPNMGQIKDLKAKTFEELYQFCVANFGYPPQTFDFEYIDKSNQYQIDKDLNPRAFYRSILGDSLGQYVSIIHAPTNDKPFFKPYTVQNLGNVIGGQEVRYLNLPLADFKQLILLQMQDNEAVWFGADVGYFGDRQLGLWDDQTFEYETLFHLDLGISKSDSLQYGHSQMNHAMVFGGVNLDNNQPTKWKIENSWGDEAGVKGYFVASDSWFDRFVYQAVVHQKYLTKAMQECLKEKSIVLNPWDPMGSLAMTK